MDGRSAVIMLAVLLPPTMLILIGLLMARWYPKTINQFVGYRTRRSMSRIELWHKGNQISMRLLSRYGLAALVVGLVLLLTDLREEYTIIVGIGLTLAAVITSLVQTELHLKAFEKTLPPKKN